MYGREYNGQTYTLEASGGLIESSLVMRDRETDSYWSLMKGEVIGGKLKGLKMQELPLGEKIKWRDWVRKHPKTLVLSVNGREDAYPVYESYFSSPGGFRGTRAVDNRLPTKAPIFAFRWNDHPYAVPQQRIEGGVVFTLDSVQVFFYRPPNAEIFRSTFAFTSKNGFEKRDSAWWSGEYRFDPETGQFQATGQNPGTPPEKLPGFDTFWYNWSLSNGEIQLLGQK